MLFSPTLIQNAKKDSFTFWGAFTYLNKEGLLLESRFSNRSHHSCHHGRDHNHQMNPTNASTAEVSRSS
ncbi:MAG: hypothetical protein P8M80_05360, partial [Pirellulaceae bacterium]|nr:hypothetical protein [Pirellulaceae bacterium]